MHRIINAVFEILPAIPFLLPGLWLLRRRLFISGNRTAAYFVFTLYLAAMYILVGLPSVLYVRLDANVNLAPFLYMFSDGKNSLLNLLLFLPLGIFLPVLWKNGGSLWRTTLFGFGLSLSIEVLQLFTLRATDVNDLITNTLGTLLGCLLGKGILRRFPAIVPRQSSRDLPLLLCLTFGVMFFLQPLLSSLVWELLCP